MSLVLTKPTSRQPDWDMPLNENFNKIMEYAKQTDAALGNKLNMNDIAPRGTNMTVTLHVNGITGNDNNDGISASNPLQSINAALNIVLTIMPV